MEHWLQKAVSLLLAISLWLMINQSLTTTRTINNVAVKLINIPPGMTIDGLLPNNILSKRIALSLQGNKNILKDLTSNDLEVVLDATDKSGEWTASISRKNLISLNPDLDLSKIIKRVTTQTQLISFVRLVTEKIPIVVTQPIGEAPRDFEFIDIWPYRLLVTVSGPEEKIKEIKAKGVNLTLNLNDINRNVLEEIDSPSDEISFKVPDEWKYVDLPTLSRRLSIDDPHVQDLRIDFVKSNLHPISKPIPVSLFFSTEHSQSINPETYSIALGGLIDQVRGLHMISQPLFAKGTSPYFVSIVQDMLQISVTINPKEQKPSWCIQFQNPQLLEDKYVSHLLSVEELRHEDPCFAKQREGYLRNRFRSYMNRFQLYKSPTEKLELSIQIKNNQIKIQDENSDH
jgi:hypothetical protein